ncbi:hypothetical protein HanPSC8_Chr11g0452931 [Helianthus annuus]|nr:hypothetical protein HanPSC8_Chr11g0452931 [Helianthus annuus]
MNHHHHHRYRYLVHTNRHNHMHVSSWLCHDHPKEPTLRKGRNSGGCKASWWCCVAPWMN